MTPFRLIVAISSMLLMLGLGACGRNKVSSTCDEPQAYQSVVAGQRLVVPEGLDPLDEYKEIPIPKSETPPRPAGAGCIDNPPLIRPAS
jgi:hypothetical protein